MRIIAGQLGGRILASPNNERTHPMSDKLRGALFNVLGDIQGLTVLDAFAGSGAVGFEAASRGAASVILIERDKAAQKTIVGNIQALHLAATVTCINATVNAWLDTSSERIFDIVICDPPYHDLQLPTIQRLCTRVNVGGLLVLSLPGNIEAPDFDGFEQIRHQHYGDASLAFYRRVR